MIGETFSHGLSGVLANKLRSALTVLGILIGVAAVIVLIAVVNGSSQAVAASIQKLGTNAILVQHGSFRFGGFGGGNASSVQRDLTIDDAQALLSSTNAPDVQAVAPVK